MQFGRNTQETHIHWYEGHRANWEHILFAISADNKYDFSIGGHAPTDTCRTIAVRDKYLTAYVRGGVREARVEIAKVLRTIASSAYGCGSSCGGRDSDCKLQ